MPVSFRCPKCKDLLPQDTAFGATIHCRKCKTLIQVPGQAKPTPAPQRHLLTQSLAAPPGRNARRELRFLQDLLQGRPRFLLCLPPLPCMAIRQQLLPDLLPLCPRRQWFWLPVRFW